MGVQPLLSQRATPLIVALFLGRTWNGNKWYTEPPNYLQFL